MKTVLKKTITISGIIAAFLIASCGSGDGRKSEGLNGSISIDGSSTVYPLTEAVAEEFRHEAPDVRVTVGLSGTGGGFKKFARRETDIANASRPIKQNEAEACTSNNIDYIELKVAYDGLAVVVNPENNWCKEITVEELKKIWEPAAQGKILKWSQIRADWPDEEIHLFGPGVESGTYDYFTEAVVGESHASRGDYTASEDDNVLVQGIRSDKYALGFFGLAYFTENSASLKLVGVDNGDGVVLPSEETVRNKTYAPLSRPLFVYVSSAAVARPEVDKFIHFFLDNTSVLAGEVGYVSMTESETATEKQKFSEFVAVHTGETNTGVK